MDHLNAEVVASVECRGRNLPVLIDMANRCDRVVGMDPPPGGHTLGSSVSAIFNGGTAEDIQAALIILAGWNFAPKEGWPRHR